MRSFTMILPFAVQRQRGQPAAGARGDRSRRRLHTWSRRYTRSAVDNGPSSRRDSGRKRIDHGSRRRVQMRGEPWRHIGGRRIWCVTVATSTVAIRPTCWCRARGVSACGSSRVPTMTAPMMAPNGTRFGDWLLNTADNTFGPVGDFDGDGHAEILVSSPWGIGVSSSPAAP